MLRDFIAEGRWPDRFGDLRQLQDFGRLFSLPRLAMRSEFPPVNVLAGTDGAIVRAEVPGVSPDQLDIIVHQNTVILRGKRDADTADKDAVALRGERAHGPFVRTITLPFRVDADKVSAGFDRGLLTLTLPRPETDKPRQVKVARV
jgi:HSP20 family protein